VNGIASKLILNMHVLQTYGTGMSGSINLHYWENSRAVVHRNDESRQSR
jgi:hypothetical protein